MAKPRTSYVCTACGHEQNTWAGICPSCGQGATLEERVAEAQRAGDRNPGPGVPAAEFRPLSEVKEIEGQRVSTGIAELDRVLGGGLVVGSFLVLAGEPGAGKTTLASELCLHLAGTGKRVAYVSGEESESQARMRFSRLGWDGSEGIDISSEVGVERVCRAIRDGDFDLAVIDSIQTMISEGVPGAPGSVSQVRECGQKLLRAAKSGKTSVLLVGQVTKGGEMAGPRILEHMVDAVLQFEGDRREQLRILRAVKNRFGNTDEIGVFEMTGSGLLGIADPSEIFADSAGARLPGSVLTATIEGSRPVLCEVQALVSPSNLPQPIRAVRGLDPKRVQMLLAVLQRKVGVRLGSYDVHINVSGGLKVDDPGTDLAVCLAVLSAAENRPPRQTYCAFGEVSLLGIARPAPQAERRRREAERLSYVPLEAGEEDLRETLRSALAEAVDHPDPVEAQ
jgi:DNA repair protein RadA/Sms